MKASDLFYYFGSVVMVEHDDVCHHSIKPGYELLIGGDCYSHYCIRGNKVVFFGYEFNYEVGINDDMNDEIRVTLVVNGNE
jgi:hypothetical protein